MIYVYIAKTDNVSHFSPPSFFGAEKEKIEKVKNERVKSESVLSHVILRKALLDIHNFKIKELSYTKEGKPYIEGFEYDFSISHSNGVCCVAISDKKGERVGVDIEVKNVDEERLLRIESRFLSKFNIPTSSNTVNVNFFIYREEWKSIFPNVTKSRDILTKWTCFEAYLKMKGTGFCDTDTEFIKNTAFSSYDFENLIISIAKEKNR